MENTARRAGSSTLLRRQGWRSRAKLRGDYIGSGLVRERGFYKESSLSLRKPAKHSYRLSAATEWRVYGFRDVLSPAPTGGESKLTRQSGTFTPSANLIEIYRRGVAAALELASKSANFNAELLEQLRGREPRSDDELQRLLQEQIAEFFAALASRARAKGLRELGITQEGQFTLEIEHQIACDFFVRPTDMGAFLEFLAIELKLYLARGGTFTGAWGQMIDRDSELFLRLAADRKPYYSAKAKARVVG